MYLNKKNQNKLKKGLKGIGEAILGKALKKGFTNHKNTEFFVCGSNQWFFNKKIRDLGRNILNVGLLCNRGKCTTNAVFM